MRSISSDERRHYAMWMLTAACPGKCIYCDIDSQKQKRALSPAEVERVARELIDARFSEVIFGGGEPLLSPELPIALRTLAGKVRTAVFTGGVPGMADRAVGILRDGAVNRIVFSIDCGEEKTNDFIRGRCGATRDVIELAALIHERLPTIRRSVNTVVSRLNADALESVWERMAPFGLECWSLTLAGDVFASTPADALLDGDALTELYLSTIPRLASRLAREGSKLVVLPVPYPFLATGLEPWEWGRADAGMREAVVENLRDFSRGDHNAAFALRHACPLVGIDIVIGVAGEIHPCSQAPIIQDRYVIGNLRDTPLQTILEGEVFRDFAAGIPHPACRRCWAPSNVPRELLASLL